MNKRSPSQTRAGAECVCVPCQGSQLWVCPLWGFIPAVRFSHTSAVWGFHARLLQALQWEDQGKTPGKAGPAWPLQLQANSSTLCAAAAPSEVPSIPVADEVCEPARASLCGTAQQAARDRDGAQLLLGTRSESRTNRPALISPSSSRPVSLLPASRHESKAAQISGDSLLLFNSCKCSF